jgi:hypothetical protein
MGKTDWYLNDHGVCWDMYGASTPQDELDEQELGERVVDWMLDETLVRAYSTDPGNFHFLLHMLKMMHATAPGSPDLALWEAEMKKIANRLDHAAGDEL